ncbi:MAG: hypothetical protein ABH883_06330 [Candidatus Omnitrophota bacterium]
MMSVFKKNFFLKAISVFMIFAFSLSNVSFAATEEVQNPPEKTDVRSEPLNVEDIGIAIDAGTIKSKYSGDKNKVIIHIQDAHCNFEAQTNINKMLDQLNKECGIDLISVEGAEGLVDTTWFRAFPDEEIRKEVATYFMKKGEITGAEFYSITSEYQGTIFGAETREYYIKNLKSFTEVYPYKASIEKYFSDMQEISNRIKAVIYPDNLKELDSKIRAFDGKDKELELSDYAEYLFKSVSKYKIDSADCPNFEKLVKTLEYEKKINFDIVDQERSDYIDALSKKLSKEQMTELVSQSISFKKGHIKALDFYGYLRDLAKENDVDIVHDYPNLFYYYIYTKLYEGIENENLFREIDLLESRLKKKMFQDETQEKLDKYSHMLTMFVNLVNIELTNEDYDLFKDYSKQFSLEDVLEFISGLIRKYNLNYDMGPMPDEIKNNIPNMIAFYEIAIKRDAALIDNTLSQMEKEGKDRCVMIAGGFHTRGIKTLLEKQGISYVVVTPKITKNVETPYLKVLTNQRTSLEDIITESAAVPAGGMGVNTSQAPQEGKMLAPVPKIFYSIPLYLDKSSDLTLLSEAIGAVEGRTLIDAAGTEYKNMVGHLVRGWLRKVRDAALKDENTPNAAWDKAVENWRWLLGAYLLQYGENARKEGIAFSKGLKVPYSGVLTEEELLAINGEFRAIFEEQVGAVAKEPLSDGAGKMDAEEDEELLTDNQRLGMDFVLKGMFEKEEKSKGVGAGMLEPAETITVKVGGVFGFLEKEYKIKVFAFQGLKEAIEEYNKNPKFGEKLPVNIVHPGRGLDHNVDNARMYLDMENYKALKALKNSGKTNNEKQSLNRLATHEFYHILFFSTGRPFDEAAVIKAMGGDKLEDLRDIFRKIEAERQMEKQSKLISNTPGAAETVKNIETARRYSSSNDSAKIVALVSGEDIDQKNWQDRLDSIKGQIFNDDTVALSLIEKFKLEMSIAGAEGERINYKRRQGNFLGTLLAFRNIKEYMKEQKAAGKIDWDYKDYVTLIGMLFGRGERMSPVTQAKGDRKPGIEVTPQKGGIRSGEMALSAVEEALLYFTPVVRYLEKRGFRGVLDKWGDETEIASIDLALEPEDPLEMANYDVIKVIKVLKITEENAAQKDWVIFNDKGDMVAQLSRNEKSVLIEQLKAYGIAPDAKGNVYAGVSLGPVAVSYDVMEIADEIFDKEIKTYGVYFDFDPYFLMALTMNNNEKGKWDEMVAKDKGLQSLEEMIKKSSPEIGFFEKVQEVKTRFRQEYGRDVNLKTLDLGEKTYWADMGQHKAMREKFMSLNSNTASGVIARKLAGIPGVRDNNGNIIINSTISPAVKVKDSVIINSRITGRGTITGGVVIDSELQDVDITEAFAVRSVRLGMTKLERKKAGKEAKEVTYSGIYESMGARNLTVPAGMRHITVLRGDGGKVVPTDMRVSETTDLRDRANNYARPIYDNSISFEQAYNDMRGVSMREIERRRQEVIDGLDRIKEKKAKFKELAFGTSGLRGKVSDMTDMEVYINARGYIRALIKRGLLNRDGETLYFAFDLRPSSPRITAAVAKAAQDEALAAGYNNIAVKFIGRLPTPAAAWWAKVKGAVMGMITGSHIPFDMNGFKPYLRSGEEVLKGLDEESINSAIAEYRIEEYGKDWNESLFTEEGDFKEKPAYQVIDETMEKQAIELYENRVLDAFPRNALSGIQTVFYQHSAVGRDIVVNILRKLRATVAAVGKSKKFVPIDTEKITGDLRKLLKRLSNLKAVNKMVKDGEKITKISAIAFTDGDSDRPGMADASGNFLPGDKLGLLCAKLLRPDFVAVPQSTNKGVVAELRRMGVKVVLTKIGSPHVIKAMNDELALDPSAKVMGWEANGGLLIGSKFQIPGGKEIDRLATRDAVFPIVAALYLMKNPENVLGIEDYQEGKILEFSEVIEAAGLNKVFNYADVYKEFDKTYGIDTAEAVSMMKQIVTMLTPKLKHKDVIAVNFADKKLEKLVEKDIAGKKTLTFETEKVDMPLFMAGGEFAKGDFDDYDMPEWMRVKSELEKYFTRERGFDEIVEINILDGIQVVFANGEVSHLRPSGNAPEFRNYTMAATQERAEELVATGKKEIIPAMAEAVWASWKGADAVYYSPGVTAFKVGDIQEGRQTEVDIRQEPARQKEAASRVSGLDNLLRTLIPVARDLIDSKITLEEAVKKADSSVTDELADSVLPFVKAFGNYSMPKIQSYGVNPKILAEALRLMQIGALSKIPVRTEYNFIRYPWAGQGNKYLYEIGDQRQYGGDVAESWLNSTVVKDGKPNNPADIKDTACAGNLNFEPMTLGELIDINPAVIGNGHTKKPFFVKSLSTRFEPKAHMGFSKKIDKEEFISWLIQEKQYMEELKNALRDNLTPAEFERYLKLYEGWVNFQSFNKWGVESDSPQAIIYVAPIGREYFKPGIDAEELFNRIAKLRARIVGVFNEIPFEDGKVILSPAGYPHAIFGLSHQTHPTEVFTNDKGMTEYPKNEAWVVVGVKGEDGKEHKILIEPQQTSNNTYSFADFYTPVVWDPKANKPKMRKDVTADDIRGFVEKGLKTDIVTKPEDFIRNPKILFSAGAKNAKLESLIDETSKVWQKAYFVVERAVLDGAPDKKASIIMPRMTDSFHELMVAKGTVTIKMENRTDMTITAGTTLFMPAGLKGYTIESGEKAEVLKFYPAEESYSDMESGPREEAERETGLVKMLPSTRDVIMPLAEGESIPGTDRSIWEEKISVVESPEGIDTFEKWVIVGTKEVPAVFRALSWQETAMENLSETVTREHKLQVLEGIARIESQGKILAELTAASAPYTVPAGQALYTVTNIDTGEAAIPAVVRVDYEKTQEDQAVDEISTMIKKHIIQLNQAGPVRLVEPKEMYASGGANDPGSLKWEEGQLRMWVNENIEIAGYTDTPLNVEEPYGIKQALDQASIGLDKLYKINPDTGKYEESDEGVRKINIVVVKKAELARFNKWMSDLEDGNIEDKEEKAQAEKYRETAKYCRFRTIPDDVGIEGEGEERKIGNRGWMYSREVNGLGLMQAILSARTIVEDKGYGNVADDIFNFARRRNRDFQRENLFGMLSYTDLENARAEGKIPDTFTNILEMLKSKRISPLVKYIVDYLLINLPPRPFDPTAQLMQRRKVMWSV